MSSSAYVTERNIKSSTVGQPEVPQGLLVGMSVVGYTTIYCTDFLFIVST